MPKTRMTSSDCARPRTCARLYDLLAPLGVKLGKWVPGDDEKPRDVVVVFADVPDQQRPFVMTEAIAAGSAHEVAAWIAQVTRVAYAATPVAIGRVMAPVLGRLAVAFSIVVGIATGVVAFYTGDPWGTTRNYLTVILVGAAATMLAQTIVDAIQGQLPPLPDQIVAKPAAAHGEDDGRHAHRHGAGMSAFVGRPARCLACLGIPRGTETHAWLLLRRHAPGR